MGHKTFTLANIQAIQQISNTTKESYCLAVDAGAVDLPLRVLANMLQITGGEFALNVSEQERRRILGSSTCVDQYSSKSCLLDYSFGIL